MAKRKRLKSVQEYLTAASNGSDDRAWDNLYNLSGFKHRVTLETQRACRSEKSCCVLTLDLSKLYSVCPKGFDLKQVLRYLGLRLRCTDAIATTKSDTCLILLADTESAAASRVGDRLIKELSVYCANSTGHGPCNAEDIISAIVELPLQKYDQSVLTLQEGRV